MSDFTKRLRQIESENSECSILAGNCADAIEIEQKKVAIEIARLRAENEKLRAALKLFQPYSIPKNATDTDDLPVLVGDLRAAAAALKETDE